MESKDAHVRTGALYALLSALLLAVIFPYPHLYPLAWVALVPFFLVLRRAASMSSVFLLTTVFGATYGIAVAAPLFQLTTTWWANDFSMSRNAFMVWSLVLVTAIYGALFFFPIAYLERRFRTSSMRDVFVIAGIWTVIEYVRSQYALAGYGWGTVGYTLADATYIRESARLIGVYGLSFLIVMVNMFIALLCERMSKNTFAELGRVLKDLFLPPERYWIGTFMLISLGVIGYGAWQSVSPAPRLGAPLQVAIIVANSDDPSPSAGLYLAYREKIIELLKQHPKTDLILFPENTFPFFRIDEETKMLATRQLVQLNGRDVLYGDFLSLSRTYSTTTFAIGLHTTRGEETHNTLVFYRGGKIVGMLEKEQLVPFFEYAPLGLPIPLFEPLTQGAAGQHVTVFGNNTQMLMCSEISDGHILSSSVKLILSPSNDGVFASELASRVHDTFARMRAIESDAYLVRANKGSISSIINPKGEVLTTSVGDTVLFETLY